MQDILTLMYIFPPAWFLAMFNVRSKLVFVCHKFNPVFFQSFQLYFVLIIYIINIHYKLKK